MHEQKIDVTKVANDVLYTSMSNVLHKIRFCLITEKNATKAINQITDILNSHLDNAIFVNDKMIKTGMDILDNIKVVAE